MKVKPVNQSAKSGPASPAYPQPVLGNPAATLMESGVGNCFPGLEFDLRQLDVRFFPGLVFAFPGITQNGPDGTQGAQLVYVNTGDDPVFLEDRKWIHDLANTLNGEQGGALGGGQWYLHWVEQGGNRIELYDNIIWQNTVTKTPYEGEIAWWIIRLIQIDPDPDFADLTIALTQRDENGQPSGHPVVLKGKRRAYLDDEGMIPDVYRPGELTASMCSPWTHDFRDCACQYWASNHPDVALGEVQDPQQLADHTDDQDAAQAVTFLDWMRRRSDPARDIAAQPTIELARPMRYDPYEINLHWEELDFVLQGQETSGTFKPDREDLNEDPYPDLAALIHDLSHNLARFEFSLAMEYLYAFFSLRAPDDVSPEQERDWPGLTNDLRAARQLILSVAISEMTHLRWVNQTLWTLHDMHPSYGPYLPVVAPAPGVPGEDDEIRLSQLRIATQKVIGEFVEVERPGGDLDTEYAKMVHYMREHPGQFPPGLDQLAVRIDSDGLNHYQKFRDVLRILDPYSGCPDVYLRPLTEAAPDDPRAQPALALLDAIVAHLRSGYSAEAATAQSNAARLASQDEITTARDLMHQLYDAAEALARDHELGVPFFAHAGQYEAASRG